ncbi:elongation factor isoform X1 [Carex rostrata]
MNQMAPTQSLEEAEKVAKPMLLPKLKAEPTIIHLADAPTDNQQQPFINSCRDRVLNAEPADSFSDEMVDILNSTADRVLTPVKEEDDLNATECSSSFGDTLSGSCSEMNPEMSDSEVESPFARPNVDVTFSNHVTKTFNKKKVTAHWRKFISPLMWRCQWLELRIKEIQNQASRYDKELAMLKHEKALQTTIIELDNSCSRVVPLSSRCRNKKAMKRRKRRKVEETKDSTSFISGHVIFSYYENKRSETDGHSVDDDCGDQVDETLRGNDDTDWLYGTRPGNSLEKLLLKIETMESRVSNLKSDLNKATCKKTKKPSVLTITTLPGANNYAVQSPSCSPGKNRDNASLNCPNIGSDDDMAEAVLPGSTVSSYGDATDLGITESRYPFSAADMALDPIQIHDFCKEENAEDVLIDNQGLAGEQYQNFERVAAVPLEAHHISAVKTEETLVSEEESTAPSQSLSMKEVHINSFQRRGMNLKRRGKKPTKIQKKQQLKKRKKTSIGSGATTSGLWRSERVKKPKILD